RSEMQALHGVLLVGVPGRARAERKSRYAAWRCRRATARGAGGQETIDYTQRQRVAGQSRIYPTNDGGMRKARNPGVRPRGISTGLKWIGADNFVVGPAKILFVMGTARFTPYLRLCPSRAVSSPA